MRRSTILVMFILVACAPTSSDGSTSITARPVTTGAETATSPSLPDEPETSHRPVDPIATAALDRLWATFDTGIDPEPIAELGSLDDPRLAWPVTDLMRFLRTPSTQQAAVEAFEGLTGATLTQDRPWTEAVNLLIAWDTPAPPDYLGYKRELFTLVDERWEPFFAEPSSFDYRLLSWGGVLIDDRPLGTVDPCTQGCIPALDDPVVTDAYGGAWLDDDFPVFGVVIGDEARAYPKHMMEVHEMVNDTLGDRRIAFPYCTLCGSAQVFLTDRLEQDVVMRTSGLLSRSNKVMFDLTTMSAFDTFTGEAVTGPLFEQGVHLDQATVVTSTWAEWRAAHPETTIIAEDGGLGRTYDLDPLGGRDDNGPIFPIGPRDPRLPVQEQVLGVVLDDGTAVAFPVADVVWELTTGERPVELGGVVVGREAGGLKATLVTGEPVASHQAFWFAWSQFHPDTLLWVPSG